MQRFQPADSENHSAARALSGPSSSGKARNIMRSRSQGDKPSGRFSLTMPIERFDKPKRRHSTLGYVSQMNLDKQVRLAYHDVNQIGRGPV